jgi:hypothetical protein
LSSHDTHEIGKIQVRKKNCFLNFLFIKFLNVLLSDLFPIRVYNANKAKVKLFLKYLFLKKSLCLAADRWSNEEFGRYGCLGDGQDLLGFFRKLVSGNRNYGPPGSLLDQLISKTKAKVDVSMPGAKLVGTGSTNFKTLLDETLLDDLQEVNIDLVAKVDKVSMKVSY